MQHTVSYMNTIPIRSGYVLFVLSVLLLHATEGLGEMRVWTSAGGGTVKAEFVEQQIDTVILRNAEDTLLDIRYIV